MATEKTFRDLFVDEVRDLYDAEKQLIKALPKLARAAASHELRDALANHLEETKAHVGRLDRVFELLDQPAGGKHCAGIAVIIKEADDLLQGDLDDAALDAGIVAGAQRVEHYEIAAYGCLIAWAQEMGKPDVAEILNSTLDEERAADEKLSSLAEGGLNARAIAAAAGDREADAETDREAEADAEDDDHELYDRPVSPSVGSEGSPSDERPRHWNTRAEREATKKGTIS